MIENSHKEIDRSILCLDVVQLNLYHETNGRDGLLLIQFTYGGTS